MRDYADKGYIKRISGINWEDIIGTILVVAFIFIALILS